ncbi:hypothetical protein BH09PLA1_BH09PLA1_24760 [soil metagenome]
MNILAYVQLRNIHRSTGHGRVARLLVEELAKDSSLRLAVLADRADHRSVIDQVGPPWDRFDYRFFERDTSQQQRRWLFAQSPAAETYWPEAQITFCTNSSYVPVRKSKLVVTLHDVATFEPGAHRLDWMLLNRRARGWIMHEMLARKADLLLTVSRFSAERIAHVFPALKNRLRVVHHGVPPRFLRPVSQTGEEFLRAAQLIGRQFALLSGGLNFRKNAELVLRAWPIMRARFPDLLLVIPGNCEARYRDAARSLGSSVQMLGFVDDEALRSLYHHAALVWFPTRYEGFGLPVIEAMACGAPVVASDCTSIPEISGSAARLAPPDSESEHIEAMSHILTCSSEADRLRRLGRARAAEFTWARAAQQVRTEFAALL